MIRSGNRGISKSILESKPFVGIGKISYSLYLWHWPLIVYWKYVSDEPNNPWGLSGIFTLSLLMAWLSWRFVEMPVRLSQKWNFKRALLWVIIGCGSIGITSTIFIHTKFPDYWTTFIIGKSFVEPYWRGAPSQTYCSEMSKMSEISRKIDPAFIPPYDVPCFRLGTSENATYLLLGDSHAMALSPGLNEFSEKNKIDGIFYNNLFPVQRNKNIQPILDEALNFIRNHPNIKTIIFINRWASRFGELPNEVNPNNTIVDNQKSIAIRQSEIWLRQFCSQLKSLNKKVILISSIPEQGINIPEKCYQIKILKKRTLDGIDVNKYKERQLNVSKTLGKIEHDGLAEILWIDDFFFKGRTLCRITNDKEIPLYIDDDHLNPTGAKELINYYNDELLRLLSPEKNTGNKEVLTSPDK